ncbi:Glutamine cyclotransferase [Ekhidna lutea]|uniref:Glutamine cyclotransferase n=1 Tax=Ekhidna lutea TaxID=447679 RepID=A0A239KFX6_EKHLU|nr:glutaminyl-peptide cyclotransferase [Ekhidna lutea]SNT16543.1 Glutamine cyclotransferase [Ekhidna lutea]
MIRLSYVIIALIFLSSCGDSKEESKRPTSPRIKKSTTVESPQQNQTFTRGLQIPVQISTDEDFNLDSVQVTVGEEVIVYTDASFEVGIPTRKVGEWRLLIKTFGGGKSETHYRKVMILPESAPENLTYKVVNAYPHDPDDYTQGLVIDGGYLYESTGQRGESAFKKKEITTGEVLKVVNLPADLFGEGLAIVNDEFYQLTWTSGQGFVYNKDMEQVRTFNYQVEGWGLAALGEELILTDETEKLYFVDPQSFTIKRELEVYDNEGKVDSLNELEVIDGLIYANVYQKDYIVAVDPETGEVVQRIDFTGILSSEESNGVDVLNGIAQDPETGKIYITGKWWPKLFEVTFQPKTLQ